MQSSIVNMVSRTKQEEVYCLFEVSHTRAYQIIQQKNYWEEPYKLERIEYHFLFISNYFGWRAC